MADGEPRSTDVTPWQPSPRAAQVETNLWMEFILDFRDSSASGYYVHRYGCYQSARRGVELAVTQWKAWELYLAEAKLMGDVE